MPDGTAALTGVEPDEDGALGAGGLGAVDVEEVGDTEEVGDELRLRVLVDVTRCTALHDAPAVHDGEAVGHLEGLTLVVGDEDEGDADLALQGGQLGAQRRTQLRVERTQRLVEQQHPRRRG